MKEISCRKKNLTMKFNKINKIWAKDNKYTQIFRNRKSMNLNKKSKKHLSMMLKIKMKII